jgi:Holliday junction resolvase
MSGAKHRRKGSRVEREIVEAHRELGVQAKRVPLSGSASDFPGDVLIGLDEGEIRGEVKARREGAGFVQLERWLGANDVLFLRRNHTDPLVVLPWATWARLLGGAR